MTKIKCQSNLKPQFKKNIRELDRDFSPYLLSVRVLGWGVLSDYFWGRVSGMAPEGMRLRTPKVFIMETSLKRPDATASL